MIVYASASSLFAGAAAAALPEIRTSAENKVPACVTPQRLMSFLKSRNASVEPRFADIANLYKRHGERWHVRWDYAFFQMAVETNFLSYKQGNGRWGDVNPRQNNFAGLGTTGGGVPGDSYPDVTTGVLAQIQHLVAYSGEHVADPVGARTKLKQDDIIESMAHLKGHVTFNDLSHRWAVDRHYGAAIEWVAGNYRAVYCKPGAQRADAEPEKTVPVAKPRSEPKRELKSAQALAPAEALGGPKVVADAVAEPASSPSAEEASAASAAAPEPATVVATAASEAAASPEPTAPETTAEAAKAPEPVAAPEATATKTAAAPSPVRTIWSRDKQDAATTAQGASEPAPAEPVVAAATKPALLPETKAAQRTAPLPIAKAMVAPAAPIAVAAAEPPAPASTATPEAASPPKTEAASPAPIAIHAPEEHPVEEPMPAVVSTSVTAAIDPAPPLPALAAPLDVRAFAFAPALNLAELSPSQQPKPANATGTCRVLTASYGGKKTLLVRTRAGAVTHYTVLTVLDGFEASMFENFVKAHAPGGARLGEYDTKDAALAKAKELCPGSAAAPAVEGASAG